MNDREPKPEPIEPRLTKFAFQVMEWMGSTTSLVVHTIVFIISFIAVLLGAAWETVLLVVTTAVSLEAIYMNILIQMGVNQNTKSLRGVEEDLDEIQEDVDEIQKDVDEIQEDVEEIEKDVDVDELHDTQQYQALEKIQAQLVAIGEELNKIKSQGK